MANRRRREAWEVYHEGLEDALGLRRRLPPMPSREEQEDPEHPTLRAARRAQRHCRVYAQHVLGLSSDAADSLAGRFSATFAEWTRTEHQDQGELRERLQRVETGLP